MALTRNSALFFIILFIWGISACGKTGALYLPDEKKEPSSKLTGELSGQAVRLVARSN